jgi:serine/threonine protein kinase/phage FluMu protein Com
MRSKCTACGKSLKVKTELAGKKVRCPHCKDVTLVSAADEMPPAPAALAAVGAVTSPGMSPAAPLRAVAADGESFAFLGPPEGPDELGRLGPYRVLKVLGTGGMGVVFKAEDPSLKRLVALKAMKPEYAEDPLAAKRFEREAVAVGGIKHNNIVTIYQVGKDRDIPYLAMELLSGEPLEDRLERDRLLPSADVVRIGKAVAKGLAAAHRLGVIHRDIKPANIWLEAAGESNADDGEVAEAGGGVKILDFGLARSADQSSQLTATGVIVGTPEFMSPEQARGAAVDFRCDLFSLGVLLYRMSTGELPFKRKGKNLMSVLVAIAKEDPTQPVFLNSDIPDDLSTLIMDLLEKDPASRPASAAAVVQRFAEIEHPKPAAERKPTPRPATPKKSPWPMIAAGVGALLVVVIGVVAAVMLLAG